MIINNAGLMPLSPIEGGRIEDWETLWHHRRAIHVSSVAGHKVRPGGTVYSATKAAVGVISEGLRQEVAERVRKVYGIAIPAESFDNHGCVCDEPARRRGYQRDFV